MSLLLRFSNLDYFEYDDQTGAFGSIVDSLALNISLIPFCKLHFLPSFGASLIHTIE